ARGLFGLPRLTVRASEILRADVTSIRPFAEFGGWGLRMRPDGTTALVTRRGEALRITTAGQQHTVVSLPDAAQAAALLNTMAQKITRAFKYSEVSDVTSVALRDRAGRSLLSVGRGRRGPPRSPRG